MADLQPHTTITAFRVITTFTAHYAMLYVKYIQARIVRFLAGASKLALIPTTPLTVPTI
jgi:hypothetical protein